jgi:hypothetical protein
MGWLMRYCLTRFKQFNAKVLGSVASVICGGAVLKLFQGDPLSVTIWGYPIGLAIGVLSYPFIALIESEMFRPPRKSTSKSKDTASRNDPSP